MGTKTSIAESVFFVVFEGRFKSTRLIGFRQGTHTVVWVKMCTALSRWTQMVFAEQEGTDMLSVGFSEFVW